MTVINPNCHSRRRTSQHQHHPLHLRLRPRRAVLVPALSDSTSNIDPRTALLRHPGQLHGPAVPVDVQLAVRDRGRGGSGRRHRVRARPGRLPLARLRAAVGRRPEPAAGLRDVAVGCHTAGGRTGEYATGWSGSGLSRSRNARWVATKAGHSISIHEYWTY